MGSRRYDPAMPLGQMASLLPYHSAVDTGTVVAALNRMIDDAGAGQTVFYDIYSEAERRADPAKAATGLFFYRGRPGAPFAVIAPGAASPMSVRCMRASPMQRRSAISG